MKDLKNNGKDDTMAKQFSVELSAPQKYGSGYHYASLSMPCEDHEITDALQRARITSVNDADIQFSVYDCSLIPELDNLRLDSPTLDELNYFAKRLDSLSEDEQTVLQAVVGKALPGADDDEIVSMKDLINVTFGLDDVSVISNVYTDEQLGEFVIEGDIHDDVLAVPKDSLYLLDKKKIGKLQREIDGGVFIGNRYIVAGEYRTPEVYDGVTLPDVEPSEWYAFRVKVAESPVNSADETEASAEWINLPIQKKIANEIAHRHNESDMEHCVYYEFVSAIPAITDEVFTDMEDFDKLNSLAWKYSLKSPAEQLKFKAAAEAENPQTLDELHDIIDHLYEYELTTNPTDASDFYKQYLAHHLDTRFDTKWLDTLLTRNEGHYLASRLGASFTDYGVISARGKGLYDLVSYDEPETKELKTQAITEEKLDVIEVLGRKALFSNGRLLPEEIPEGLYAYDLRQSDDGDRFVSIESKVGANHGGTVLMRELLDFGETGYIELDDDTSPNFLGYDLTPSEFSETDFSEDEDLQMGEMQL